MKSYTLIFCCLIYCLTVSSQKKDSVALKTKISTHRILGNSWYFSASYNISRTNEVDLNIGRTYGIIPTNNHSGLPIETHSYGLGFGLAKKNGQTKQLVKAFYEYGLFYIPPICLGARADYFYNLTDKAHYLRPSLGFSLLHLDIFYNYSFNLSNASNDFGHGISFRLKYFHKKEYWEKTIP
jgi:hypothetical protein